MEQVRSFVAIELPEGLKEELVGLSERLKSSGHSGVRWVDPRGIHLTLKFLGDVAVDQLDDITAALTEATREISTFRLEVGGLGVFPNPRRVRVAWVGVSGETDKLQQLQQRVESSMAVLGFAVESRGFTPHLTLARVRDQVSPEERQRFGQVIESTNFKARHDIEVNTVYLMRSQLTRQGAIYSSISSVSLDRN
ncbi:MAG: RNA 2',3'-cyclic phosphodiesterase [Dehalococcoidales bacterium]|nr:MAG: RNA 2',3'-cyclic phosphodiesterase [Dehalococcoidales bacterium]